MDAWQKFEKWDSDFDAVRTAGPDYYDYPEEYEDEYEDEYLEEGNEEE